MGKRDRDKNLHADSGSDQGDHTYFTNPTRKSSLTTALTNRSSAILSIADMFDPKLDKDDRYTHTSV